ncbi:MAG: oligopeptide/dipeptide ABC transporter ATP-binding protein [Erysipelotrichaceae bacterium]
MANEYLIKTTNLKKYFPLKKNSIFQRETPMVKANDGIDMAIKAGETFGLVGESGCGKSTLGRVLLQLYPQTHGNTIYYGRSIYEFNPKYVLRILKNLENNVKKMNDLEAKMHVKHDDHHTKSYDKFHKHYEHVTRLAGGLVYASDLAKVKALLIEEYNQGVEEELLKFKQQDASAVAAKRQETIQKLDALRVACNQDEKFLAAEANRDGGIDLGMLHGSELRLLREDIQIIFQDPYSSLNPRLTVGQIISEALVAHKKFKKNSQELEDYVIDIMEKCGLDRYFIHRYPHQFSGGQRQRIGIARALALRPKFIVCDEAVSALDVSIQSQVINLLQDLKEQENLTYLFITHDLSVVKYISDRIGVMYLGNMVELAEGEDMFRNPLHPYTEALLNAIPTTDMVGKELEILEGDIPSPINPPKGCKFHTRCKYCFDKCKTDEPKWEEIEPNHWVACHLRSK